LVDIAPRVARLSMPTLSGDDVTLRAFENRDFEAVMDASNDPLIPRITTVPDVAERASAYAFIARQRERSATGAGYSFAIEAGGEAVGQIGLWLRDLDQGRATIGYWIRPSRRRQGHARDALAALTEWALSTLQVPRVQLYIEPANVGSWRTAERVGYEREGLMRSWEVVGEERRDMFMYAITT